MNTLKAMLAAIRDIILATASDDPEQYCEDRVCDSKLDEYIDTL